jgi:hypothetical protein
MSYFYNNIPIMPGAYLVFTNINNYINHIPLFSSIASLVKMGNANYDVIYYVLPGYKLQLFSQEDYLGTSNGEIDNTNGTKIMYKAPTTLQNTESIKMYYENTLMIDFYNFTNNANNSGSTTTNPTSNNTIGPYKLLQLSIFPGAYLNSGTRTIPIFFSISNLNTFLDLTINQETSATVMPGYKLILYFDYNQSGTYVAIDNTSGTKIVVARSNDLISGGWTARSVNSFYLYFNGNVILQTDIVS